MHLNFVFIFSKIGSGQIVMTSQEERTGVQATLDSLDLSRFKFCHFYFWGY